MPKSKRNVTITLSKVKKKDNKKEKKNLLIKSLTNYMNQLKYYIYVLDVRTYSNNNFKEVIEHFKPNGKIYFGKNKLMKKIILEYEKKQNKRNLDKIVELLIGNRILLITTEEPISVVKYFNKYRPEEYIKTGNISPVNVTLKSGDILNVPVCMQKDLQKNKLNFDIIDEKIIIREDKILAEINKVVSSENAKLLRMLNMKITSFDITVLGYWYNNNFISYMT